MAKTKRSRDGKARLMMAAAALFGERPAAEVGIAEILKSSGVQAPTLYHHFGDKEGLFAAWAIDALGALKERVLEAQNAVDPIEGLIGIASAIGESTTIDIYRTLEARKRMESADRAEQIERAYFEAVVEPACIALMRAQDAGRASIDSVEKAAAAFVAGALAVGVRSPMPASGADSDYRWQTLRFVYGFVRPLP